MPDERPQGAGGGVGKVPGPLLEQLRRVLTTYSGPKIDDGEVSRALRAVATDAQAQGVRAEQLLASLKRVFDSLPPPDTLPSPDDRLHRLSYLVTTCVREYYAVYPGSLGADAGPTR
jgi:hypothetical protein